MKSNKHSKIKNTSILFEMIVRQITADALEGKDSKCVSFIKKWFNPNSELGREYILYKSLYDEKFNDNNKSDILIESVLKAHKKINKTKLNKQKYELIGEIKKNYNIDEFFKPTLNNYKVLASIYKLFEFDEYSNPLDYAKSKITIMENMSKTKKQHNSSDSYMITERMISELDPDLRILTYKNMVKNFNNTYNTLNKNSKRILKEYVNSVNNSNEFKTFLSNESDNIRQKLTKYSQSITDDVIRLKLSETTKLLDNYKSINKITDGHVLGIMKFYELIEEFEWQRQK